MGIETLKKNNPPPKKNHLIFRQNCTYHKGTLRQQIIMQNFPTIELYYGYS